ncbi:hypothetical protein Fmac_022960 [Flemingia macrophylla]|uniref:DUF674 domain-containing protein n=1 Tax=Flemingia macrophylla TaxID=520843 RepID=A0ABD1LK52_9FABA
MASSSTNLTLKLLIDTKRDKVLFAEASKAVVDFFFNLLCLPISSVIRLLSKTEMVGCLGNLYESVENLNDTYMQPDANKDVLLKPMAPISSAAISGLLPSNVNRSDKKKGNEVLQVAEDVLPNKNGFMKEVVTYMIMDDLVITPMSTISSITLLNKFNVKEVGAFQVVNSEVCAGCISTSNNVALIDGQPIQFMDQNGNSFGM